MLPEVLKADLRLLNSPPIFSVHEKFKCNVTSPEVQAIPTVTVFDILCPQATAHTDEHSWCQITELNPHHWAKENKV